MTPSLNPTIKSSERAQRVKALAVKQVKQENNDFVEQFYIFKIFKNT